MSLVGGVYEQTDSKCLTVSSQSRIRCFEDNIRRGIVTLRIPAVTEEKDNNIRSYGKLTSRLFHHLGDLSETSPVMLNYMLDGRYNWGTKDSLP